MIAEVIVKNISPKTDFSAFCLAATHSGSGKTTITLALLRALRQRGYRLQPYKCGPDYIDPTFHERAAGCPSINLDTWMMGEASVRDSFARAGAQADVAVVEGVMGLFDSFAPGVLAGSSADCARLLDLPVILVVEARGMAGSIAALVKGFCEFNREIQIVGVIANQVGSPEHGRILAEALERAGLPPLLGALPRIAAWGLEERHLGLVPFLENNKSEEWFAELAAGAETYLAIDRLLELVRRPRPTRAPVAADRPRKPRVRLALARDSAFHFYYPDNLDRLREAGFELVEFSPISAEDLPSNVAALYLGGGFPEVFAAELAANQKMRAAIQRFAAGGGLVYGECGGFMYLGRSLTDSQGRTFPMCGVLDGHATMRDSLKALGYREITTLDESLFGPAGTVLRGHEFHWSEMAPGSLPAPFFRQKDRGGRETPGGVRKNNVFASYVHLHFSSCPEAALNWVAAARS
ncbi:MAG TPA: cobyrinate a,c-diamide synthase [Proteobacteria bacterium]|nr:cobyrinate a,c-diamide synthase [Pseudomonadota bacterium]